MGSIRLGFHRAGGADMFSAPSRFRVDAQDHRKLPRIPSQLEPVGIRLGGGGGGGGGGHNFRTILARGQSRHQGLPAFCSLTFPRFEKNKMFQAWIMFNVRRISYYCLMTDPTVKISYLRGCCRILCFHYAFCPRLHNLCTYACRLLKQTTSLPTFQPSSYRAKE